MTHTNRDRVIPPAPRRPRRPGAAAVLLALWTLFILYGTLLPFDFSASWEQVAAKWAAVRADPARTTSIVDLTANVLLFLPWGALVAIGLEGRRIGPIASTAVATALGAALSASVEMLQLLEPERYTSPFDVLTNGAGAALGAVAGWLGSRWAWPVLVPRLRRAVARDPMAALAVGTAAAIGLAAITPFDIRPDERSVKEAIKRARLIPFGPAVRGPAPPGDVWSWTAEALAWSLAGGVYALALRESGGGAGRSVAGGAAMVAALAAACEMAQVFVASRRVDATSIVLAAAGGVAGAASAVPGRRRAPSTRAAPALVAWATVLILTQWSPPRFVARSVSDLSPAMLVPFLAYYQQRDLNSLADVVNEVSRTVPLGALLAARWAYGRGTVWRAALVGFGAGALLEVGQLFVVGRYAEITDAFWAATGSAFGFALWRRGRALVARRGRMSGL